MANLNRVTVMGVLGRDPETKNFPNGGSITTFSMAISEFWKDKNTGERKEATEWHRIATSQRLAEISSKTHQEGQKDLYRGFIAYKEMERPKQIRKGNNRDSCR
mgnify:CR=1 FL=1